MYSVYTEELSLVQASCDMTRGYSGYRDRSGMESISRMMHNVDDQTATCCEIKEDYGLTSSLTLVFLCKYTQVKLCEALIVL